MFITLITTSFFLERHLKALAFERGFIEPPNFFFISVNIPSSSILVVASIDTWSLYTNIEPSPSIKPANHCSPFFILLFIFLTFFSQIRGRVVSEDPTHLVK